MLLALGSHQFDVTHRAIVMGVVDRPRDVDLDGLMRSGGVHVDAGADCLGLSVDHHRVGDGEAEELEAVVVAVTALRERFGVPVCVDTARVAVARAAHEQGAAATRAIGGSASRERCRVAAHRDGSIVIVRAPGDASARSARTSLEHHARIAEDEGIPRQRVLLEVDAGPSTDVLRLELWRHQDEVARLGWPLVLSTGDGDADTAGAAQGLGIAQGVRVLRTRDVRAARRVAAVAARLLEARDAGAHDRDRGPVS